MSKVVLIRPHMLIPRYSFTGLTVPPLGLAYVAACLQQKGHEVVLIDSVGEAVEQHIPHNDDYILHGLTTQQILERIPEDTDFIGFSCMFSHEFPIYRDLIEAVREQFLHGPLARLQRGNQGGVPLIGILADAGATVALGPRALYDAPARQIEKR